MSRASSSERVGLPRAAIGLHATAAVAASDPQRIAVRHADGASLSYAELDALARRTAAALQELGVQRGSHVATLLENGFDAQGLMLGIGWLCAVEVPIHTGLVGALLRHALASSDAELLVTTSAFAARVAGLRGELPRLARVALIDEVSEAAVAELAAQIGCPVVALRPLRERAEPARDLAGPEYRDIAAILFTSGTTGPSKPVLIPWALIYHNWSWVPENGLHAGEGLYCALALFHNSGRAAFNAALVRGATYVYREKFSATQFWGDVRRHECRIAGLVGPLPALLYSAPPRPDDADNPLRGVLCGPMFPEVEAFEKRFDLRVATGYGQTEVGMALTTDWDHGPWQSCGRARRDYPFTELRIVDGNDEPVATGEVGELIVRSREPWSLNAGYYKLPEATAAAWRNGWFHTGDAFRCDAAGNYYLVDRLKDAIRRRGENISSFEVESAVAAHPEVVECAAVAVPAALGEDEVLIFVIARDAARFDPRALLDWLAPRMPKHMLPRYVERVDDLPRNATTGRILKHELRARGLGTGSFDRESGASGTWCIGCIGDVVIASGTDVHASARATP